MSRIAYVNGRYCVHADAAVHVEDRGYQFADGIYEVCEVSEGRLVDERRHMERLKRSLSELRIPVPMSMPALSIVLHETVRRNRVIEGLVYVQITRGVAPRDHGFPPAGTPPALVVTAKSLDRARIDRTGHDGITVVTLPDNRWERVDIKSVALLPNVLAKQTARERGAREAWFVDRDGRITEGASSNAWIVTAAGELVTRPADHAILRGITRTVLLEVIAAHGLTLQERPFTVTEAYAAREAFVTSASQSVQPVVRVDDHVIGEGKPGPIALTLRGKFHGHTEFS
jgi:D-alanine transaminase